MSGTGQQRHQVGHQRGQQRNVAWMTAQQAFRQAHQIIHATCHLHGGYRGDHCHDDFNHIERDSTGCQAKSQRQDQHAHSACEPDTNAAKTCAQPDRHQDDEQLNHKHE